MYEVYLMTDMSPEEYAKIFDDDMTDCDFEETLDMVCQYTNYEHDALGLPNINDKIKDFNKLVGYENMSDEGQYIGRVIYWCETPEDVIEAIKNSQACIGGIDEPIEFEYHGKDYIYDADEWEGNSIVMPLGISRSKIRKAMNSLDDNTKRYLESILQWTL